jgi:hypothetical protein
LAEPAPPFTALLIVIGNCQESYPREIFVDVQLHQIDCTFLKHCWRAVARAKHSPADRPNCGQTSTHIATMGSLKRKEGPDGASASKTARAATESRPSKRAKSSDSTKDSDKKRAKSPKSSASKPVSAPLVSQLKEEEPLFPRGGGSVLTPLEQKQIQIQAKKDVLFEEATGKKGDKVEGASKKKKRKSRGDETAAKTVTDEDAVKVESLNFKVLTTTASRRCMPFCC